MCWFLFFFLLPHHELTLLKSVEKVPPSLYIILPYLSWPFMGDLKFGQVNSRETPLSSPSMWNNLGVFNRSVGVKLSPLFDIWLVSPALSATEPTPGRARSSIDS